MRALWVCLGFLAGAVGAAAVAVAQVDAATLIASFQDLLDERIEQSGIELPGGARDLLRVKIVEGVARLEQGGLERVEIAEAEQSFEIFVSGVLESVQAATDAGSEEATAEAPQQGDQDQIGTQVGQTQQELTGETTPEFNQQGMAAHVPQAQQQAAELQTDRPMSIEEEAIWGYCPPPRLFPWCV